jgi:GT2 family glycosyltransferase
MHSEWQFELIGSTFSGDVRALENLPNIRLLGEKPYAELPSLIKDWDCCLIPFKRLPLTEATNPVKVYEMLAAGKPVVAVDLPELRPLAAEGLITIPTSPQDFAQAIQEAMNGQDPVLKQRRRDFASRNQWRDRQHQFACAIRETCRQTPKKASVLIVTYNNLKLTRLCLDSVFRTTEEVSYEIIVVDNGSEDQTPNYLRQIEQDHDHVSVILNPDNAGFAVANNQAVRQAHGQYIAFLNNDTVVTPGWLSRMISHLEADPALGMVGPVTNAIGNEARIDVEYTDLAHMESFAARYTEEHGGQSFEVRMLALFCAVIRRELLEQVGLLDERYEIGMFEDDDLAQKIRQAGRTLRCVEDVFVHHASSAAFQKLASQEYQRIFQSNRRRYEDKWGVCWQPHRYRQISPRAA